VLLIHGMMSDALLAPTIRRMKAETRDIAVMHVPDTGHTPVLSDRNQNWFIHEWLMDHTASPEWTVLHAKPREDPPARPVTSLRVLRPRDQR
jgi:hypothetical protein